MTCLSSGIALTETQRTPTVSTFDKSGEYWANALLIRSFLNLYILLHNVPSFTVNNGFVGVFNLYPFILRNLNNLFILKRFTCPSMIDERTQILLTPHYFSHSSTEPMIRIFRIIARQIHAVHTCHICSRYQNRIFFESLCDVGGYFTLGGKRKHTLYYGCGIFVNNKAVLVIRILFVTVWCKGRCEFALLGKGFTDGTDFL